MYLPSHFSPEACAFVNTLAFPRISPSINAAEEVDLGSDMKDWAKLNDNEK